VLEDEKVVVENVMGERQYVSNGEEVQRQLNQLEKEAG
jgi:hypothetical protein